MEIHEDDSPTPIKPDSIARLEPGMQIMLAFNPGITMLYPATGGQTRFQVLRGALQTWAGSRPAGTPDTFDFLSGEQVILSSSDQPENWLLALQDYSPDLMASTPSLASLTRALDFATDPLPNPLSKRVILWITPVLPQPAIQAIPSLAERAAQIGVKVVVWLAASAPTPQNEPVLWENLNNLAALTGGEVFLFHGENTPPDLESFLSRHRYLYQAAYTTRIRTSGSHTLQVMIRRGELELARQETSFDLKVMPPNPFLLSPVASINRTWTKETRDQPSVLQPDDCSMKIMVEFPDGHTRSLKSSRLLVDGFVVDENFEKPFDTFTWNLTGLTSTGTHRIQVEVEDELGLTASTIETLVDVNVEVRITHWWDSLTKPDVQLTILVILVAAAGLAGIILLARRRPRRKVKLHDPLTQPVPGLEKPVHRVKPAAAHPTRNVRAGITPPAAQLQRLDESGHPLVGDVIEIRRRETTFGSDPDQAMVVIPSPSVNPLHARLVQLHENDYLLADAESVAGTWVNYAPVSKLGVRLLHGDLVHFGRASYRFLLAHPSPPVEPQVSTTRDVE